MSIATLINRECVLLLRESAGADVYGNETTADTLVSTVCELQPRRVDEAGDGGEVSDDDYVAHFLPDQDLSTADAVVVDGETYEFTGRPPVRRNPRTQAIVYATAFVRRVAGAEDVS